MKIFSIPQISEADAYTIAQEPVAPIDLMERAAIACTNWITERYDTNIHFKILCGLGNNGGDGLAIARLLAERGYTTEAFIINYSEKRSADFITNYERLKALQKNNVIQEIHSAEAFQQTFTITPQSVVIDAVFGSGLNKPLEGLVAQVISHVNKLHAHVIAVDVPSGLFGDEQNAPSDEIMIAEYTLSFQFPKLSFMLPETAAFVGEFDVLDLGLHPEYIAHTSTKNYFITKTDVAPLLKNRSKSAHKGNFGHSLIIAGSKGKMGAAVLASKACLRSGTGLLTVHVPACGNDILQISIPEAMSHPDTEQNFITELPSLEKYKAIGIGPGIGQEKQTENVLKLLIQNTPVPLVLDADALNILSENKTWLAFIPANSIFTPHPKEFERLAGKASSGMERLQLLREFSIKNKVYVILKGAHTAIGCPDGTVFFNSTGNPGMAKGGSGDALTGMITALLAQHYTPEQACIIGVYLHGLAGNFAARASSVESMLASDLIDCIGDAFNYI
ncbi:MAG: carbohydrate kinase, YjeF related protein [Bacteroidetes bacterium]|nr:carbohydrate kinase, YjeF related protein [Bacteroidota bacterium]